jgi:putative ATP-dependent endonuclease of the OLD family
MIISGISLENFRSFRDRTDLDLQNINIFVGPNKAGKSNIIMCLQFLNAVTRNDWHNLYNSSIFDYDTNKMIRIEVVFKLDYNERLNFIKRFFPNVNQIDYKRNSIFTKIKYAISLNDNEIVQERLSVQNTKGEYIDLIVHEFEGQVANQYVSNLGSLFHINEITEFDNIKLEKKYGKWNKTSSMFDAAAPTKTPEYYIGEVIIDFLNKRISIFSSANIQSKIDLMKFVTTKLDKETREYVDFLDLIKEIIDIPNIEINRGKEAVISYDDESPARVKYHGLEFPEQGLTCRLPFFSLSYGSQHLLHILTSIENADAGDAVCIEEPENHLHSNVQKKLFKRIIERCKSHNVQFFITTHSSIFTALIKDVAATYLITRTNAISNATVIENDSQLKLIKQHLGVENSDIYLSQYVIFVEGQSEERSIQIVGRAMGYEKIGKDVRIIDFEGKDRIQRLTEFLKYIHYFDTKAIILADGHPDLKRHISELSGGILTFYDKTRDRGIEFEDLFDSKTILKAMKNVGQKMSFDFEMDEKDLEDKRKQRNVSHILKDYMDQNARMGLNKTLLADELCSIIVHEIKEIKEKGGNRNETKLEEEIRDIMNIVEGNR